MAALENQGRAEQRQKRDNFSTVVEAAKENTTLAGQLTDNVQSNNADKYIAAAEYSHSNLVQDSVNQYKTIDEEYQKNQS
jgi:hypothetical protein